MPNSKTHFAKGAAIGLVVSTLSNILKQAIQVQNNPFYKFNFGELALASLAGVGIGGVFGILPDILEPATCGSYHRKFCHSITAGSAISYALYKVNSEPVVTQDQKDVINIAGAAYLSHLLLDSETPRGLPWVA